SARLASRLGARLQLARPDVDERLAQLADALLVEKEVQDPAGVDVELVGGLRAPAAEVLQPPGARQRREVAGDALERHLRRRRVLARELHLDRRHLRVELDGAQRRAALAVALEDVQRAEG